MTKTYFITASAYMHQNLFQRTETADLLLVTLFRYRDAGEFLIHEFVVMLITFTCSCLSMMVMRLAGPCR